jgi:hypothetical protein
MNTGRMNADDRLRAVLRMEADTVEPSPAGWDAIRTGVAARRRRTWWVRGSAVAAAAALSVAGVVFALDLDGSRDSLDQTGVASGGPSGPASPGGSSTPTPASTAPAPVGANDASPIGAIWPLTTRGEVAVWAADHATYPSLETADGSALAFARNYVGVKDAAVVARTATGGDHAFDVTRPVNGSAHVVTSLTVRGFGNDGGAPFVVTGATSPEVAVERPGAGDAVGNPLAAHGTFRTVDPSFTVTLRADGPGSAPVDLASGKAVTGPPNVWDLTLAFTTTARTGSLLVTNGSLVDSGVASATAVPVTFGTAATLPGTFVSVRDGRVALFATATGTLIRYLTDVPAAGTGPVSAALSDDGRTVVYAVSTGTCSTEIRGVPVAGGASKVLVAAKTNHALDSPDLARGVPVYREVVCTPGRPASENTTRIVVGDGTTSSPVDGAVRSGPVAGDRFAAWVTAKNGATTLHTMDMSGELADVAVAPPKGCNWLAATWAPGVGFDQPLVTAVTCGSQDETGDTRLYRSTAEGNDLTLIGYAGSLAVVSLDSSTGGSLLVGTLDSNLNAYQAYTFEGGALHRIAGEPLPFPSWR